MKTVHSITGIIKNFNYRIYLEFQITKKNYNSVKTIGPQQWAII